MKHAKGCQVQCAGAKECEVRKLIAPGSPNVDEQLGPCVPVRSSLLSRQTLALNLAILTGGILLVCMAIPQREAVFVPGTLSAKHSQILGNRLVSERCSLCHPNSHAFSAVDQDSLCMKCHEAHMPDAVLQNPHDVTPTQFAALRRAISGSKLVSTQNKDLTKFLEHDLTKTQCAMCHVEHHGLGHDLKTMSDQRCQSCHQRQFASFENGHPEFVGFPYRTERHLAFDHQAHAGKHFAQKNEAFDCRGCHLDTNKIGDVGPIFRSVGFDVACARCHTEPMRASMVDGWALLQIPSIESADVLDSANGLTSWPTNAQFGYDGPISLPMRFLLSADADAAEAIANLPASGQLSDVNSNDPTQVDAARRLAAELHGMILEVAQEGQSAWKRRLASVARQALKRELNAAESTLIDEMVAGLPPDLFRHIERQWFGTAQKLAGNGPSQTPLVASLVSGQDLLSEDSLLGGSDDGSGTDALLLGQAPLSSEDAILNADALLDGTVSDNLLLGSDDSVVSDDLLRGSASPKSEQKSTAVAQLTKLSGIKHVSQGGWYLDEELLAVRYMPQGHADPLLAAWAQFAVLIHGSAPNRAGNSGWHDPNLAVGKIVPGGCTECHVLPTTESALSSSMNAAWKSVQRPANAKPFTRFDHSPHLALPMVRDCRYCHVFGDKQDNSLSAIFKDTGPMQETALSRFVAKRSETQAFLNGEFSAMQKSQCNACHREGAANDGCTQCHNYHVGTDGFEWSQMSR